MKQDSRRDQKGLRVFTGQETTTRRRTVAVRQRVLAIVTTAIELEGGCTIYRLDAWTAVDSVIG